RLGDLGTDRFDPVALRPDRLPRARRAALRARVGLRNPRDPDEAAGAPPRAAAPALALRLVEERPAALRAPREPRDALLRRGPLPRRPLVEMVDRSLRRNRGLLRRVLGECDEPRGAALRN